jgi:2-polyprenyl-3-methyl-5-hydroxy-6-metoxy-1,4-benzoquinol methylase/spore coat polysaccharide biosynthesis protein SpsF (cytidylyltransferase family)
MKISILIQVASTNWNGGADFSVKQIDGEVIYEKTLQSCRMVEQLLTDKGHTANICFILPDRTNERAYFEKRLNDQKLDYFFGNEHDVLNRILDCSEKFGMEHVFRVNGSFWYLDKALVSELIDIYAKGEHDLVKLPANFPHGFAGEFFSINALKELRKLKQEAVVNPITAITDAGTFKVYDLIPGPNVIDQERVDFIRLKRLQYEPERAEYNEASLYVAGSIYYNIYHKSLEYMKSDDIVLDIASGEGYGSEIIAGKVKYVYGGDYNIETVRRSTAKYNKLDNLNYVFADVTDLPFRDNYFDVLTSMETIEHVDEDLFVDNVHRVLKPGGYLIITTPQNDYGFNLTPWHVKEYSANEIRTLLNKKFEVVKIFGCASGDIFEHSETGDRMLVVARKK